MQLLNHERNIEIKSLNNWQSLIEKTYTIKGNITQFTKILKEHSYPHTDFMRSESKYLHYGVAAALANINTKKEMIDYLSTESGHDGFVNIMKAYELLGDRVMCLSLFKRFLKFCNFLVT
ncbi:MAG: hypothetical protein K2Q21_14515 [Chitinophagaceae bacterium]|nr:hypothetical protein [Chitinophagaceae bacterium]